MDFLNSYLDFIAYEDLKAESEKEISGLKKQINELDEVGILQKTELQNTINKLKEAKEENEKLKTNHINDLKSIDYDLQTLFEKVNSMTEYWCKEWVTEMHKDRPTKKLTYLEKMYKDIYYIYDELNKFVIV